MVVVLTVVVLKHSLSSSLLLSTGGFFAISVYEVDGPANPTLKPADEDTLTAASGEGYVSLGCHADLNGDRIMGEDIFATSTVMTGEVWQCVIGGVVVVPCW